MGSLNPVQTVFNTLGTVLGSAEAGLYNNYRQISANNALARQSYRDNDRAIQDNLKLEYKKLAEETAEENRKRQQAMKRAVATQQARYGAQGIETAGGSGEAVLLGLFEESDAEKSYRDRLNKLKQESLQQDADTRKRRNLLSLQSQYQSGQNNMISSLGRYFS